MVNINDLQVIKGTDGAPEYVLVPVDLYEDMAEAFAAERAALADARDTMDDALPMDMIEALLAGENPIAVWRKHRGLSQQELADRVGVAQSNIARAEKGGDLRVSTLRAIAGALGCAMDDLIG